MTKIVCENSTIVGIKTTLVAIITDGKCNKSPEVCDNVRCDHYTEEQWK